MASDNMNTDMHPSPHPNPHQDLPTLEQKRIQLEEVKIRLDLPWCLCGELQLLDCPQGEYVDCDRYARNGYTPEDLIATVARRRVELTARERERRVLAVKEADERRLNLIISCGRSDQREPDTPEYVDLRRQRIWRERLDTPLCLCGYLTILECELSQLVDDCKAYLAGHYGFEFWKIFVTSRRREMNDPVWWADRARQRKARAEEIEREELRREEEWYLR